MPFRTGENPDASHPELAGEVFLGLYQASVFLGRSQGEVWRTDHGFAFEAEVISAFLWLIVIRQPSYNYLQARFRIFAHLHTMNSLFAGV